jgi:hypothetical protein
MQPTLHRTRSEPDIEHAMEADFAHAYIVRPENGHWMLVAEGGGSPPELDHHPTALDSLEEAAARILNAELGIEVDDDVIYAFAHDVLEPRLPQAKVSADQLWQWIDV